MPKLANLMSYINILKRLKSLKTMVVSWQTSYTSNISRLTVFVVSAKIEKRKNSSTVSKVLLLFPIPASLNHNYKKAENYFSNFQNKWKIIAFENWIWQKNPFFHFSLQIFKNWKCYIFFILKKRKDDVDQDSQSRGPPDVLVRPANTSKNDKSIKFDQIRLIFRGFLVYCGPQKLFSYKLRPAEHFFSRMWPSDQFEFETPDVD
jgi:hypothetical protein